MAGANNAIETGFLRQCCKSRDLRIGGVGHSDAA